MSQQTSRPNIPSGHILVLIALILASSIGVVITTANDLGLGSAQDAVGLTDDETAYYEYVSPRLDRLVAEVDDVVVMVEGRSRDILDLTISGDRIETLTRQITGFGETHGVPPRFETVHEQIVSATDTTTYTFDQARESLRTFNFSNMSNLVTNFESAANELHEAQDQLQAIAGGTAGAITPSMRWADARTAGPLRA